MKTPLPLLSLACLAVGSLVSAQSVTPAVTRHQAPAANDETIMLNPFVISAGADDGYAPTETLSGTRLKTQAKDVASAITIIDDRGARLFAYIDRNLPEWQAKAGTPVNSTLGATVGQLATLITTEAANDKLTIGIRQTRSSEWQFSGVARYRFDPASRLKGFAAGSAFTWRDEPVIGYKVRSGTALFDITQPFFGAKTFNVDAWVEYSRVIFKKRVRWESQLRVQNVLNNRNVAPWTALDDGTGGRFVEQRLLPSALGVSLSSTFRF